MLNNEKRITRRDFLKRGAAVAATLVAGDAITGAGQSSEQLAAPNTEVPVWQEEFRPDVEYWYRELDRWTQKSASMAEGALPTTVEKYGDYIARDGGVDADRLRTLLSRCFPLQEHRMNVLALTRGREVTVGQDSPAVDTLVAHLTGGAGKLDQQAYALLVSPKMTFESDDDLADAFLIIMPGIQNPDTRETDESRNGVYKIPGPVLVKAHTLMRAKSGPSNPEDERNHTINELLNSDQISLEDYHFSAVEAKG